MEIWIARDKDGTLALYTMKPTRVYIGDYFSIFSSTPDYDCMCLDPEDFPQVTWENSPQKVTVELVKEQPITFYNGGATVVRESPILSKKVSECNFSVRANSCLKAAGIETVRDIVMNSKNDLLKLRNFGWRSLHEVEDFLTKYGLTFGMIKD